MTQPGGPAAINGFLYQVLHHIGWLANATLTPLRHDQSLDNLCFVLEPLAGVISHEHDPTWGPVFSPA